MPGMTARVVDRNGRHIHTAMPVTIGARNRPPETLPVMLPFAVFRDADTGEPLRRHQMIEAVHEGRTGDLELYVAHDVTREP